jgi:hypothetical protein
MSEENAKGAAAQLVKLMRGMNGHRMSLEQAAKILLHGDEDDEDRRREQPKKIVTLPPLRWLQARPSVFWNLPERDFAAALAERKQELSL